VDSSAVRIYLSTELTDRKLYTLMHDSQYRAEVARQQTVYNQPSYTSFYLASDVDWAKVPVPDYWAPGSISSLQDRLDEFVNSGDIDGAVVFQLTTALDQAEHHIGQGKVDQAITALELFLFHLDNPVVGTVSDSARSSLAYHARTVISMLS
jgi:hypothetical protein